MLQSGRDGPNAGSEVLLSPGRCFGEGRSGGALHRFRSRVKKPNRRKLNNPLCLLGRPFANWVRYGEVLDPGFCVRMVHYGILAKFVFVGSQ